jgi:hypothetical protein
MFKKLQLLSISVFSIATIATSATIRINASNGLYGGGNTTYEHISGDMYDLDHNFAYAWKINLDGQLAEDAVITGAKLHFENITDWQNETDSLFLSVLDIKSSSFLPFGVNDDHLFAFNDGQAAFVDYFSAADNYHYSAVTDISTWSDINGYPTRENVDIDFAVSAVNALNAYKADDNWIGIGLDPDCHYWNDGIWLELTTSENVPEPTSLSLMFIGLTSLGGAFCFRRKK